MKSLFWVMASSACLLLGHQQVLADSQTLLSTSNFVTRESELSVLNAAERKQVEAIRARPNQFKSSAVITLNNVSLAGRVIVLVLPTAGKRYQFAGEVEDNQHGAVSRVWSGKDEKNGATLIIADNDEGTYGELRDNDRIFRINSLPGKRFYVIAEVIPQLLSEPTSDGAASKGKGR